LTAAEMSSILGLPTNTVLQRLNRAGIKPFCKDALYTQTDLEVIRNVKPKGWPRKKSEEGENATGR
jgi:hypothetical protein